MGTRSKGRIRPNVPVTLTPEGVHESDSVKLRYKKNERCSKLARRIRRRHNRGRDFTKVLGYQFATSILEKKKKGLRKVHNRWKEKRA